MRLQLDKDNLPQFPKKLDTATNTAAVLTVSAVAGQYWAVDWVRWSYDDAPTGGKVTIAIGGTTIEEFDITASGPGIMHYYPALYKAALTKNEALVITLAAGGAGITGKICARVR